MEKELLSIIQEDRLKITIPREIENRSAYKMSDFKKMFWADFAMMEEDYVHFFLNLNPEKISREIKTFALNIINSLESLDLSNPDFHLDTLEGFSFNYRYQASKTNCDPSTFNEFKIKLSAFLIKLSDSMLRLD
jgi:hypothetical protein